MCALPSSSGTTHVLWALLLTAQPATAAWQTIAEAAQLTASDAEGGETFGNAAALSGSTALVGAPFDEHSGISAAGSVYVLGRNQGGPGAWGEVVKLTAADPGLYDIFGRSLAISGDTAVIGAPGLPAVVEAGSAYVFERNLGGAGAWGQVAKLTASDAAAGDDEDFGQEVAIYGDCIVVGCWDADVAGVNNMGAAYVFERHQGGPNAWGEVTKLTASDGDANDLFGSAVAVDGDMIIVGASAAGNLQSGAAYVFERDHGGVGAWGEVSKLTASDPQGYARFGGAIAIQGETLVIGAPGAAGLPKGAAYVFARDSGGAAWAETTKLIGSDTESGHEQFGTCVSLSDDTVVIGADAHSHVYPSDGAAYVFERDQGGPGAWGQVIELTSSAPVAYDSMASSVAVSGSTILVGVRNDEPGYAFGTARGLAFDPTTPTLYGTETDGDWLITLDEDAEAGVLIGKLGFDNLSGLDFDSVTHTLYGADTSSDQLVTIDTLTGVATAVGSLGFSRVDGLAFDPSTGTLYGSDTAADVLITIDTTTGQGALVGPIGIFGNVAGLAFDPAEGVLYGSEVTDDELVMLDTTTGAATVVGPMGFGQVAGMAFNSSSGMLYGLDTDTLQLISIDPVTGAGTAIGSYTTDVFQTGSVLVYEDYLPNETYCTAGTSASGCQALMSASGIASASASSGFYLSVADVEGDKDGLFFYGTNGRQANSWGNGTSFVCVVPPRYRGGLLTAQGSLPGTCEGSFTQDLNARWCATCPKPNHNPGAGALLQAQCWYRDPASTSNQTSSMSDAIEVLVGP